jgi:hypothetical protein
MDTPRVFGAGGPLLGVPSSRPTVSSDNGVVRLNGTTQTNRDPSWTAPGTSGWSPNAPQGAYNPGGPFWRPY